MEKRRAPYERAIRERMERYGRTELDPRQVEAWMRLARGTLDSLSKSEFTREVKLAFQCIDSSTAEENEQLAQSLIG